MINLPSIRTIFSGAACLGVGAILTTALAKTFEPTSACIGNTRLLFNATAQYAQDWDEGLPRMSSVAAFQSAVQPYTRTPKVFTCPETGKAYVPNPALTFAFLPTFADPSAAFVVQDQTAHADGLKTTVYLDGIVTRGGIVQGDTDTMCFNNVRQIAASGLMQYVQDYDGHFPPMDTPGHFRTATNLYVGNRRSFLCPATNTWYQPNKSLSLKPVATVTNPATTVVASDDVAHADGNKTVGYVDGHVTRGTAGVPIQKLNCQMRLNAIAYAITQYTFFHDGKLPPTDTLDHLRTAVSPYLLPGTPLDVFTCPDNHLDYVVNPALSEKQVLSVDPNAVLIEDPAYNDDGTFHSLNPFANFRAENDATVARSYSAGSGEEGKVLWTNVNTTPLVYSLSATGDVDASANIGLTYQNDPAVIQSNADGGATAALSYDMPELVTLSPSLSVTNINYLGLYEGWNLIGEGVGPNGVERLLWTSTTGQGAVWTLDAAGNYVSDAKVGPAAGQTVVGFAVGQDNLARVLLAGTDGSATVATVRADGSVVTSTYAPFAGYIPTSLIVDSGNHTRILGVNSLGNASLWQVTSTSVTRRTNVTGPPDFKAIGASAGDDGLVRILFKSNSGAAKLYVVKNNGDLVSIKTYTPS